MDKNEAANILTSYVERHSQPGEPYHVTVARLLNSDEQFRVMYANYRKIAIRKEGAK